MYHLVQHIWGKSSSHDTEFNSLFTCKRQAVYWLLLGDICLTAATRPERAQGRLPADSHTGLRTYMGAPAAEVMFRGCLV